MSSDNDNRLIPSDRRTATALAPDPRAPERRYGYGYGYGYAGAVEDPGGINIREYLRVLRKNKWLILTIVVVATTIVTIASYRVQDTYQASVMLQISEQNSNVIPGAQPVVVYDPFGKGFATQLRLLQMPDLIRRVVVDLDLEHNSDFFSRKPATLTAAMRSLVQFRSAQPPTVTPDETLAAPVDPSKPLDDATIQRLAPYVGTVIGGLSVNEVKGTQLVSITFQHHDPVIAAKVANSVAENFVKEDLNQRVASKATTSDFLQKRIADLQTQIRAGEERLLNYGKTHEILSLEDESQNTVVQRLEALNQELLKVESQRRDLEATRELMKQAAAAEDVMRIPAAQTDTGAIEISKRLTELRQHRSELLKKYTEEWPAVKVVNEQIAQLEQEMVKVKARLLANAEADYESIVKREKALRATFEQQRAETMQQNEAAISARIIQQEVETNKKLLEVLLQRSKEVDISAASERSPILIKNQAEVPGGPSGPNRSRWMMLAFVLSLCGGVGLAFGREYLDQTIKSLDDIDRIVRLPSLGVIPALSAGSGRKKSRLALPARGSSNGSRSTELISSVDAKSSAAEAYRQLRTSVLLSSAGHPSRLVLVTSSQPREGKTTTAVNTAISLAQTGASTLIVDCDMRKPRVHQLLNCSNNIGVSLYLSGQNEDLGVLVQDHQIPNLSVLPCGPIPPNPAELLGSDQMRKLLEELVKHYDHVVIDTPPVISFADPVILSTMVDGVILVVRGGYSNRGVVVRSRQLLADVGAKIYGVVLNDADMKSDSSYYYYGSYYTEYYGKDSDSDV